MSEIGTPAATRPAWHWAFLPIGVFLVLFGLLNFAELPLGWKDRVPQIAGYLQATVGLDDRWATPTLWCVKTVEAALGVTAVVGLIRRDARIILVSIVGWLVVFTGYSAMDVWAADRAELLEHTLYFAAFSLLLLVVLVLTGLARAMSILTGHLTELTRRAQPPARVPQQVPRGTHHTNP